MHGSRRKRAIVLLHGMTASPAQFERVAQSLFDARAQRRGSPPAASRTRRSLSTALARLRPDDLYRAVRDYVEVAHELGEEVTVAGFSLGGLLAAWIGQRYSIDRCVPIAPFFGIAWIPNRFMNTVAERCCVCPIVSIGGIRFYAIGASPRAGYPRYATHAIAHSYRIARGLLDEALTIRPGAREIAIITNAREVAVNNYAIRRFYRRWQRHRPNDVTLEVISGLPLSHDIVSPERPWRLADRVHPMLLAAIDP